MRIGILGTGNVAAGLGAAWAKAGHQIVVAGRSAEKATALAERIGGTAAAPREAVAGADAVLLAVAWEGVEDTLRLAGAADGALAGVPLIDPANAVEHGVGVLLPEDSAAQRIAALAPGAHVVKAFHLFAAEHWATGTPTTVPMCGDDPAALETAGTLVRDVSGIPAVVGPLSRARQLEEAAGLVIALAFGGFDPGNAFPRVPR